MRKKYVRPSVKLHVLEVEEVILAASGGDSRLSDSPTSGLDNAPGVGNYDNTEAPEVCAKQHTSGVWDE